MTKSTAQRQVAILGTGYIADWHVQALRAVTGATLAAVCDVNLARAREFAERYRIPSAYGSVGELLSHRPLDAVHVLTPPETHVEVATSLVDAGIHVLLEKPMGVRAEECERLVAAAGRAGVKVAVSHNFLFSTVYERLRRDVASGVLGRLDEIRIVWNKELGQVAGGPFDGWLFREPENVMLEIGPHSVAHMLDLAGSVDEVRARASRPIELPGGRTFYRRWRVDAEAGPAAVSLVFSFAQGFTEHAIQVRGSLASATADFERNTYVVHQHTPFGYDLDRSARVAREARALKRQAHGNLRAVALAKVTKSPAGNPFGESIARSLASFYEGLGGELDRRISGSFGVEVVALCEQIGRLAELPRAEPAQGQGTQSTPAELPRILVLGATGFIGRELIRQLTAQGRSTRVLARKPGGWAATFDPKFVEVMAGDASRPDDLERSLAGISHVIHLARAQAKTWAEYQKNDVDVTRRIAEACQKHGVKRLIYASSIAALDTSKNAGTITDDTPVVPSAAWGDPYSKSKAANEETLMAMHRGQGLPVVIVRPGIVLGRGGSPFHFGVGYWPRESICQFYGDGTNPLPIVLVEDVATALIATLDVEGIEGQAFNLVAEPSLSAREYLDELERCSNFRFEKIPTPIARFYLGDLGKWVIKVLVRHHDPRRPRYREWDGRSQRARFDCSRTRKTLAWTPIDARAEIIRRGIHEPMAEVLR
jgi:predicted dehydrogenase/nucleoside-diphosphate-sugar epimerase